MMTLEEAIKHAEEVAKEQEELYRLCPASESEISCCDGTKDCKALKSGKNKGCQKCAEEHRQLAEWLKDYKRLLEQKPILDKIKAEIIKKHLSIIEKNDFDNGRTYGYEEVLEIIDKYRGEEDETNN